MVDLPPGFRFYPTEEELMSFYFPSKLEGKGPQHKLDKVIPVVDIYEYNPWDLARHAGECCREDKEQWFFFVPMHEKEGRGGRPNRLTSEGYWKATGSPGYVYSSDNRVIGTKRTMVFYKGRAPNGQKTIWKMNEYNVIMVHGDASSSSSSCNATLKSSQELRLCRVYIKSKSVRSFDRRPMGVQMVDQGGAVPGTLHVNEMPTSVDNHQAPLVQNVYTISHSDSSSPSGDDLAATSNTCENTRDDWDDIDQMVSDNNKEMWDWWAQFNIN